MVSHNNEYSLIPISFHFLPFKLLNKRKDFSFPLLKFLNKRMKEYFKLFFSFLSILFYSLRVNVLSIIAKWYSIFSHLWWSPPKFNE